MAFVFHKNVAFAKTYNLMQTLKWDDTFLDPYKITELMEVHYAQFVRSIAEQEGSI